MTSSSRARRGALWSAPVLTAAAVVGLATWPSTASASAHPRLPARSAAQLLSDVQGSDVQHFSGTVVETARLGLPSLPGGEAATLSWQTLVTGSHTLRVWVDGPERQRIALLGQLSESDVIHNGKDLWTFASDTQSVGHTVLSESADRGAATRQEATRELAGQTPAGAADAALKAIDPSTKVTVDRTQRVAGRPAYTLVLTPRDTRSTVREVAIAVDAQRKIPLRVQVFGSAAKPAFEIGFSDISFRTPSPSAFRFTPPRGTTVSRQLFPMAGLTRPELPGPGAAPTGARPGLRTVGSGWTTVLVSSGGPGQGGAVLGTGGTLDKLFVSQPDGSRLLRTALVNVLVTPNGTVAVGAVQPALLRAAVA